MYQPSTAWGAQVSRTVDGSWMRTRVPGGASGVRLKSKAPWTCAHAESLGLIRDERSKLRLRMA